MKPASAYKWLVGTMFRLEKAAFLTRPVFIVSCGRSGSTALCLALRTHPSLLVAAVEGPTVGPLGELAFDYALGPHAAYFQGSSKLDLLEMRCQIRRLCYTSLFGATLGMSYDPRRIKLKESAYTRASRVMRWGAKVFPTYKAAQGLRWLYPGAKFIYLFRNGVDVVHSMSKFGVFSKLTFEERCRFWSNRTETYQYLQTWDDVCLVRFENFLNDNARVLKSIYDYLEVSDSCAPSEFASSRMVHPLDAPTVLRNPKEVIGARGGSFEVWTASERTIFKSTCGEAMRMLGYDIPF